MNIFIPCANGCPNAVLGRTIFCLDQLTVTKTEWYEWIVLQNDQECIVKVIDTIVIQQTVQVQSSKLNNNHSNRNPNHRLLFNRLKTTLVL
jgi:hypothetical protein